MTTDPLPSADQADAAEQDRDVVPAADGSLPDSERNELPDDANVADVLEQQTGVPGSDDDDNEA